MNENSTSKISCLAGLSSLSAEPLCQLAAVVSQPCDVQVYSFFGLPYGAFCRGSWVRSEELFHLVQMFLVGKIAADGDQPHQTETTNTVAPVEFTPSVLNEIPGQLAPI